jgi:hypothetical protein
MNKLAFCFVTLGIASLTCAQAAPTRPAQAPSPRGGDDLQGELKQLHRELRELRTLVDQMAKESGKATKVSDSTIGLRTDSKTDRGPTTRVYTIEDGKPKELKVETKLDGQNRYWVGTGQQPMVLRTDEKGGTWSTVPMKVGGADVFKVDLKQAKKEKADKEKAEKKVKTETKSGTCSCCENCPCCQGQKKEDTIAVRVAPENATVRVLDGQHLVMPRLDVTPMTVTMPHVITLGDRNCTPARGMVTAPSHLLPTLQVVPPTPAPKKAKAKSDDDDDEKPVKKHRLIDV